MGGPREDGRGLPARAAQVVAAARDGFREIWLRSDASRTPLATVERFDLRTWSWTTLPPMSLPRVGAAMAVANGTVLVLGGRSAERRGATLAAVECFDLSTATWKA